MMNYKISKAEFYTIFEWESFTQTGMDLLWNYYQDFDSPITTKEIKETWYEYSSIKDFLFSNTPASDMPENNDFRLYEKDDLEIADMVNKLRDGTRQYLLSIEEDCIVESK